MTGKHKVTHGCEVEGKLYLKCDVHCCSFHPKVFPKLVFWDTGVVHVETKLSAWVWIKSTCEQCVFKFCHRFSIALTVEL